MLGFELGVFESFHPKVPGAWADTEYVLLANLPPALQREALGQLSEPRLVACDTMAL